MSTYSDDEATTNVYEYHMQIMDPYVENVCSFIKHARGEVTSEQRERVKHLVYSYPDVWMREIICVPEPLDKYLDEVVFQHLKTLASNDPQRALKIIDELRFNELLNTWIGECKRLVKHVKHLYWDLTSPAPSS